MKFDFAIGNPPYQVEAPGTSTSDKPVYDAFMDAAYQIAKRVELITPGRFLFNAGATPSKWNKKMLSDEHIKVLSYETDSAKIFPNTSIAGGIAITYRNENEIFGEIGTFTSFPILNDILQKVRPFTVKYGSLDKIIYTQNKFNLEELNKAIPGLNRKDKRLESNIFQLEVFTEKPIGENDLKILGLSNKKRVYRYINSKYIDISESPNIKKYKVLLSKANGASGTLGNDPARLITVPFICEPYIGYTRTFISIGSFDNLEDAEVVLKYVKSKFCRVMLGVLKITQGNNKEVWREVPLQDFTNKSDINWSVSVANIDRQLYKKYGLSEEEIRFIESHVKEME